MSVDWVQSAKLRNIGPIYLFNELIGKECERKLSGSNWCTVCPKEVSKDNYETLQPRWLVSGPIFDPEISRTRRRGFTHSASTFGIIYLMTLFKVPKSVSNEMGTWSCMVSTTKHVTTRAGSI
jgi:hypothetical protein